MKNCSFFILLAFILVGCAVTKAPAPIEYNHENSNLNSSATIPTISDEGEIISNGAATLTQSEIINPYNDNDYVLFKDNCQS